jgi:hypothetical protein
MIEDQKACRVGLHEEQNTLMAGWVLLVLDSILNNQSGGMSWRRKLLPCLYLYRQPKKTSLK